MGVPFAKVGPMSTWFLIFALSWWLAAVNVGRPIFRPSVPAALSFLAGWLVGELAPFHIAAQIVVSCFFLWRGALDSWVGWLALGIAAVSWTSLGLAWFRGFRAGEAVELALQRSFGPDYLERIHPSLREDFEDGISWQRILRPFRLRRHDVQRIRDVEYHREGRHSLLLDVYRPRTPRFDRAPVLLHIHGGGWTIGSKNEQGLPMVNRLAAKGWVCFSIDYRLSPRATYPDHILDVKRALAWVRENAAAYGGDPDFVIASGESAGGHLAALLALTHGDRSLQPGFEHVDTRIAGVVPLYGVYDFTESPGAVRNRGLTDLLQRHVVKKPLHSHLELYRDASPIHRVHDEAPPFFIVHGELDTLVPVEQARTLHDALSRVAPKRSALAEIPGAQHAFELFISLRTELVLGGIHRFTTLVYSEWLEERQKVRKLATSSEGAA
jgi:acetyl esterase/lipase